jgi:hypothetical protein
MKSRWWRGALALTALSALIGGGLSTAQAQEIPADLEFSYTMSAPLIGSIKEAAETLCYQSQGESFALVMAAGPAGGLNDAISKPGNEILCTTTIERVLSNVAISGTANASAQGQSGSGSFNLVCEVGQRRSSFFSIAVSSVGLPSYGANPYGSSGSGHVSCTWTISVDDAAKSQLAGSLEMFGDYNDQAERVSCEEAGITVQGGGTAECVAYDMTVKAYLTGATGAYAGRTGEGTLTQRAYAVIVVPINLDIDTACPPDVPNCDDLMGGGGEDGSLVGCEFTTSTPADPWNWMQFPALAPGMPTPPGWQGPGWYKCASSGGGGGGGGEPPADYDPTIPPCVPGEEGNVPPEGFSVCINAVSPLARALESAVRASTGEALSLATTRKAGTTRFVSPAQTSTAATRDFGNTQSAQPSVRLATAPGAVCTVTAKAGRATATLVKKVVAVGGQLDTKVTAPALMSKLKATKGSQATVTASCAVKVGKKSKPLAKATVTVRFA